MAQMGQHDASCDGGGGPAAGAGEVGGSGAGEEDARCGGALDEARWWAGVWLRTDGAELLREKEKQLRTARETVGPLSVAEEAWLANPKDRTHPVAVRAVVEQVAEDERRRRALRVRVEAMPEAERSEAEQRWARRGFRDDDQGVVRGCEGVVRGCEEL